MKCRPTNKELCKEFEEISEESGVDCTSSIMQEINSGRINMRSRWFVLTEYLGLRTTWVLLILTLVTLVNIILYIWSRAPEWQFLEFGSSSYAMIIQNLPFGWMAVAAILLIGAIVMMTRFSFSYVWSFHIFVIALLSTVFVGGGAAFASGLNDALYNKFATDPEVKDSLLAKFYCFCNNHILDSDRALTGEVLFKDMYSDFVIETPDLEIITVMTGPGTKWFGAQEVERFEMVKVLGKRKGDMFIATHIKVDLGNELALSGDKTNCFDEEEAQRKREVHELRKRALTQPLTPSVGAVQLIRSIH